MSTLNVDENVVKESDLNKEQYKEMLLATVNLKYGQILASKPQDKRWLEYTDAQTISHYIRTVFKMALKMVPKQVEAQLMLTEAVLAPSTAEQQKLIKNAAAVAGGAAGIGLIVYSVLVALGVGTAVVTPSLLTAISAFFLGGTALGGPIGFIVGGVTVGTALAIIAGVYAFSGTPLEATERYHRVLTSGLTTTVDAIWLECETGLVKHMNDSKSVVTEAKE